jgi:hypothetical protein
MIAGEQEGHTEPDAIEGPVRYEKADPILRIALDMQGTAESCRSKTYIGGIRINR